MATSALKPWIVQFGAGGLEVQSFDGSSYEAEVPAAAAQGKQGCLGWHGEWLLMRDDATAECFLLHLPSQRRVHLPRLSEPPGPGESSALALASNSSSETVVAHLPDCTVVLSVRGRRWLLHCRPGDEWWGRVSAFEAMDDDDGLDLLDGAAVAHGGRVYVATMGGVVAVLDATFPIPRVESYEATLPPTCPTHLRTTSHLLLESAGDILCVRLYLQL